MIGVPHITKANLSVCTLVYEKLLTEKDSAEIIVPASNPSGMKNEEFGSSAGESSCLSDVQELNSMIKTNIINAIFVFMYYSFYVLILIIVADKLRQVVTVRCFIN
jgi:hypothetical protein